MTKLLIGIGGTGSKIVESALFLLAAGVGPRSLTKVVVGLVDQDGLNGNCGRTEQLLALIGSLQTALRGNANRLVHNPNDEGWCDLLRIELDPLFPAANGEDAKAHWKPEERPGQSLSSILDVRNKDSDRKALFDLLYAKGEQDLTLEGGYEGRAHLGAAAMRAAIDQSIFHSAIEKILNQAGDNLDNRIFLGGSAFGGTGAAGFPTIARHVNRLRRVTQNGLAMPEGQVRCRLGGVLMLPYFQFEDPDDPAATVVRSSETLRNSRVALEYYNGLAGESVFDRLFLAGWDRKFALKYCEPKGPDQKNPPLPPELYAALAAIEFLTADDPTAARPSVIGRASDGHFAWADLPRGEETRDRLGRMLRLAVYWRLSMTEALRREDGASLPLWKHALATGSDHGDVPHLLDQFFEALLVWATSLELFAGSLADVAFGVWNGDQLVASGGTDNPREPVTVRAAMPSADTEQAYSGLIPRRQPDTPVRSACQLFAELNDQRLRKPTGKNTGLGRLMAQLHHGARTEEGNRGADHEKNI